MNNPKNLVNHHLPNLHLPIPVQHAIYRYSKRCKEFVKSQRLIFPFFLFPIFCFSQNQKISLDVSNEKIEDVLLNLAADNGFDIIFTEKYFSGQIVSLKTDNQPVTKILKQLLKKTKVDFKIADQTIILSKRKRIFGYLTDGKTGEKLINAAIYHLAFNSGSYTNEHGFFSFELPFEANEITASYIGYKEQKIKIGAGDISLNIELEPEAYLSEVVILSSENSEDFHVRFESPAEELLTNKINSYVATGGVPDVFQFLYKKAGVASGPDGLGGLHVRGGDVDQNLILLDGVKVYHPNHSFGLYSIFNPTLLQHAKFSKSNFNPRQGGRLSSVLDLRLKEGSTKEWGGSAAISNITSEIMLDGPLQKDKTGMILSFRRSHVDALIKSFSANRKAFFFEDEFELWEQDGFSNQFFYDFNAKIHHNFDKNNRLYLSAYTGNDRFTDTFNQYYDNIDGEFIDDSLSYRLDWSNQIYSARWNQILGNNLFSNLTASYSGFSSKSAYRESVISNTLIYDEFEEEDFINLSLIQSGVDDFGLDYDFDLYAKKRHHLTFGAGFHWMRFEPGTTEFSDETYSIDSLDTDFFFVENEKSISDNSLNSNELHIYFNENYSLSKKLNFNLGLRASTFKSKTLDSLEFEDRYFLFQPRIAIQYQPITNFHISASAERIEQPVHILTLSEVGFPTDLWVPASDAAKPQVSEQFNLTLGYQNGEKTAVKISGFHKTLSNLIRDIEGLSLPRVDQPISDYWQLFIVTGNGLSQGIEVEAEYQTERFRGDLAYAITKTTRQFEELDSLGSFPFRFDQRHSIALNAYLKLTPKIWVYANWQFASGIPQTLFLDDTGYYDPVSATSIEPVKALTDLNAFQLPNYHRLDAGFLGTFKKGKWTHELNIGVQNAYKRRNVWYEVELSDDLVFEGENPRQQRTGLPILPVLRYQAAF